MIVQIKNWKDEKQFKNKQIILDFKANHFLLNCRISDIVNTYTLFFGELASNKLLNNYTDTLTWYELCTYEVFIHVCICTFEVFVDKLLHNLCFCNPTTCFHSKFSGRKQIYFYWCCADTQF